MLEINENTLFNALAQLTQISSVNKNVTLQQPQKVEPEKTTQIFKLEKKIRTLIQVQSSTHKKTRLSNVILALRFRLLTTSPSV